MTEYTLSISVPDDDLRRLYAANGNIVLARALADAVPNVAWLVFRPFPYNLLHWSDDFGIYASNVPVRNGAVVLVGSSTDSSSPVQSGFVYTMSAAGTITGPVSGGTAGAFTVVNDYENPSRSLTFGVLQSAKVNGEPRSLMPASAMAVGQNGRVILTPATAVCVWLQANIVSGTIVTAFTTPITTVPLTEKTARADLVYDAATGTFITSTGGVATSVKMPTL